MLAIIAGAIQLALLVLQNKFNQDAADKQRKDALHASLADAIKKGDTDRINDILVGLRK